MTSRLRRQHEELIEVAQTILDAAAPDGDAARHDLTALRLRFARLLNEHCDDEADAVRDGVAAGRVRRDVAASFSRDLMMWRADLAACNGRWTPAAISADRVGFRRAFGAMIDRLRDYVQREERDVLALLGNAAPSTFPSMRPL